MTYGVIAVKGVAVYAANDGRSNILGVGDTEYVERLSFKDSTPQYSYQAVLLSVRGKTARPLFREVRRYLSL